MKYAKNKSLLFNIICKLAPVLVACIVLASNAKAATSYYLDQNGTTPGSGITANGTYSWEGSVWNTDSTGVAAPVAWVDGGFARFAAGSDATGSYTVNAGSDHTI